MMQKYISKPVEPTEVMAIQICEANKDEIEKNFSAVLLREFYHDENHMSHVNNTKSNRHNKLGYWLFIHDAHCAAYEGDYILLLKDGKVTARRKEDFDNEFQIVTS